MGTKKAALHHRHHHHHHHKRASPHQRKKEQENKRKEKPHWLAECIHLFAHCLHCSCTDYISVIAVEYITWARTQRFFVIHSIYSCNSVIVICILMNILLNACCSFVHVSISSCAWHFQSYGDSALQSSPFAIQYRSLRIHFSSHPRFLYPHVLSTTINIQFEFSIRENGLLHAHACIWLLPKNYPGSHARNHCVSNWKSNINAIKQWRYCSIAICKWNWNLYVEHSLPPPQIFVITNAGRRMGESGWMKRQNSRLSKMKTHK